MPNWRWLAKLIAAQTDISNRDQVFDRNLVFLKFDPVYHQAQNLLFRFKARMHEGVFHRPAKFFDRLFDGFMTLPFCLLRL